MDGPRPISYPVEELQVRINESVSCGKWPNRKVGYLVGKSLLYMAWLSTRT